MNKWESAKDRELLIPFSHYWVYDGMYVIMAEWVPYRWHIGRGIVYDTEQITHFRPLDKPSFTPLLWKISPPPVSELPFGLCWVYDGKHIGLAAWKDDKWVPVDVCWRDPKITHYLFPKRPGCPELPFKKNLIKETR